MFMTRKSEPNEVSGSKEVPANPLLDVFQKYALLHEGGTSCYDLSRPPVIARRVLDRLKEKVDDIPPLPEIWHKVQGILNDPGSAPSDLGRIVAQDSILSAQLLRVCSSSAYKTPGARPVTNVTLAIARIGMAQASSLILQSAAPVLGGSSHFVQSEIRHVWFHSLAISLICRCLVEPSKAIGMNEIGMLGLLHDIGKLVILHVEKEADLVKLAKAIESGVPALKAESEILGYTHIDAGMMLSLHWRLPKQVSSLILSHHNPCALGPDEWPEDMTSAIVLVHTAHIILQDRLHLGQGKGMWSACQRTHPEEIAGLLHTPLQLTHHYEHMAPRIERELGQLKEIIA